MSEDHIVSYLVDHGFVVQKDKNAPDQDARGWSNHRGDLPRRLEHPAVGARSSLYVAPDFVAASGRFKKLAERVPPTDHNRKEKASPYPYWEGNDLARLLEHVGEAYS